MGVSFLGPALIDVAERINSDIDEISSKASIPSSFVSLVAAIGIGFLIRFINRQWFIIASFFVVGSGYIWLPNVTSILSLAFCLSVESIFHLGIDIASNAWLLALWRGGSTHLMQGLHCTWAFGSAVAPLVVAPFLSLNGTEVTIFNKTLNKNVTFFVSGTESRIIVPYYISAGLHVIFGIIFMILYFFIRYDESNEKSESDSHTEKNSNVTFSKLSSAIVVGMAIIAICTTEGAEVSTAHFTPAMIVGLGFSKSMGAYMSSARAFIYAISRIIGGFAACKFPIQIILFFSFFTVLGSCVIIIIATNIATASPQVSEALLWIGFAFMGLGYGPIYPGIMSFTESYVKLSDFTVGLFIAVGSVNVILQFYVIGHWIKPMPTILIYYVISSVSVSLIVFISLILFIRKTAKPVVRETDWNMSTTQIT